MAEVGSLKINLGLQSSEFNQGLSQVNKKLSTLKSEFKATQAGAGKFDNSLDSLRGKADVLSRTMDAHRAKVAELRKRYEESAKATGENSNETLKLEKQYYNSVSAMKQTEDQLDLINKRIDEQSKALDQQNSRWGKLQDSMNKIGDGFKNVGSSLKNVGQDLSLKVTAPIVGLGTAAVTAGMSFEESMSKVAAVSGATGEEFAKLEAQAKELGAATQFSASEAASGMEFLARAGFDTQEIYNAMPGMLDLAASSAIGLGQAADIASNIMSGFGINASEAGHVADVLAQTAASANTDVLQLGEAMKYAAPVAASLGISMEEAASAVAFMSDAGIQGSQAGTALRAGLLRLADPANEAQQTMEELGLNVFDASGKMLPMADIVAQLQEKMSGLTEQQKTTALSTIFGTEAVSGWMAVIERGPEEMQGFADSLVTADGAASQMAQTMNDNAKGSLKEMMSALEGLAIELSDILLPIVRDVVQVITEWTRKFAELSPSTQKVILAIAGIAAAIGPVLVVVGTLASSIGAIISVFGALSGALAAAGGATAVLGTAFTVLTGPIGIAIAAIAGLVAAGVAIYKNWDVIKEKTIQIWDIIKSWLVDTWNSIKDISSSVWDGLKKYFMAYWEGLNIVFINPITKIGSFIFDTWKKINEFTMQIWTGIKDWFVGFFVDYYNYNKQMWENVKNLIMTVFNAVKEFIVGVWTSIREWFTSYFTDLLNYYRTIWNTLKSIVTTVLNAVKTFITNTWNNIKNTTMTVLRTYVDFVRNSWESIRSFVVNAVTKMKNTAIDLFRMLFEGIRQRMEMIRQVIVDLWERARSFLASINLFEIGQNIIQGLINGIGSMIEATKNKVKEVANGAVNSIKNVLGIQSPSTVFKEIGKNTMEGLAIGIDENASKVDNEMNSIVDVILNKASDFVNAGKRLGKSFADALSSNLSNGRTKAQNDYVNSTRLPGSKSNTLAKGPDGNYYTWEEYNEKFSSNKSRGGGGSSSSGGSRGSSSIGAAIGGAIGSIGGAIGSGIGSAIGGAIGRYHTGGWVGLRSDEVPAILQKGEFVLSRKMIENIADLGSRTNTQPTPNVQPTQNVENNYNMNFYSPKALDPYETSRMNRNALREMALKV